MNDAQEQSKTRDSSSACLLTIIANRNTYVALQRVSNNLEMYIKASCAVIEKADIAFEKIVGNINYLNILERSQWPLHLVDDEEVVNTIRNIDSGSSEQDLVEIVGSIAINKLDTEWVGEVHKRWCSYEEITPDEQSTLARALSFHIKGDYSASVAMLMCLIDGLVCKYCDVKKLESDERAVFNWIADKYGVWELPECGRRRKGNEFNVRDRVIILLLNADDGLLTWKSACTYLIDIVFANECSEKIANTNPLRNKICHGKQLNYGTVTHSLKAILATDIVIRLGRIAALLMKAPV